MIIDIHTHAFPDAIAQRAIAKLESLASWKAVGAGTIASLVQSMNEAGVDASVICAIATKPDQAAGILEWCRGIRSDRIIPFPSVHPDTPDAAAWVRRFADEGFRGIKLHPMYQDFAADDARADAIYAQAAKLGLLVTLHCGRDIAFAPDDDRASAARMAAILARHEGIKLVCTHLGGWKSWDESYEHLVGRNVYLETSFSLQLLGAHRATELIKEHGAGRVLFGTDWPWQSQSADIEFIRSLEIPEADKAAVLGENAAALLYGVRQP
ncbi:MAG: amidohydrolase family protein [Planctomycetaceae bacterium]|nr:amidohydrolase family protein [Planctomycetaceae bacterium]